MESRNQIMDVEIRSISSLSSIEDQVVFRRPPEPPDSKTVGRVQIETSHDITIGNPTVFNGNVVIQKYVKTNAEPNSKKVKKKIFGKKLIYLSICLVIILGAFATFFIYNLLGNKEIPVQTTTEVTSHATTSEEETISIVESTSTLSSSTIPSTTTTTTTTLSISTTPKPLEYWSREDWEAKDPTDWIALDLPAKTVVVTDTNSEECFIQWQCPSVLRRVQYSFMAPGYKYPDIPYNFMIGGEGTVYEGRNRNHSGAYQVPLGDNCIVIAFIGQFDYTKPKEPQIAAYFQLIENEINLGTFDQDYEMFAARQKFGDRPGKNLYALIKTWPHWKNVTESLIK